jgi:thiamine-phosphate pyrophosphorylase
VLLYYITDRKQFPGGEAEQQRRLLDKIIEAAGANIDYIQLREKDLPARALEQLAREAMRAVREHSSRTRLLINSRPDVALACGADGVHLTTTDISAGDARAIASSAQSRHEMRVPAKGPSTTASSGISASQQFLIAVSTHSLGEIEFAYGQGADFVVFGPVFEKVTSPQRAGVGFDDLRRVCTAVDRNAPAFPVLALGGITLENAADCINAGASGIAAIRLFQENEVGNVITRLRAIGANARSS